jgi:hypothetical protein
MQEYILSEGRKERYSGKAPRKLRFEILVPRLTMEGNTHCCSLYSEVTQNDKVTCCAILRHLELKSTVGN